MYRHLLICIVALVALGCSGCEDGQPDDEKCITSYAEWCADGVWHQLIREDCKVTEMRMECPCGCGVDDPLRCEGACW